MTRGITERRVPGEWQVLLDRIDAAVERRDAEAAAAIAVLQVRHENVEEKVGRTDSLLEQHITGCAKLQKYQLIGLVGIGAWLIGHSVEAEKAAIAVLKAFAG